MVVHLLSESLPGQAADVAFPAASLLTYSEVQNIKSKPAAYIAAEFTDEDFPANGQFGIGQRNHYTDNGDLTTGEYYTFFLRAFPKLTEVHKRQTVSQNKLILPTGMICVCI